MLLVIWLKKMKSNNKYESNEHLGIKIFSQLVTTIRCRHFLHLVNRPPLSTTTWLIYRIYLLCVWTTRSHLLATHSTFSHHFEKNVERESLLDFSHFSKHLFNLVTRSSNNRRMKADM